MTRALPALLLWAAVASGAERTLEVSISPGRARPGDLVLVTSRGKDREEGCPKGKLGARALRFVWLGGACRALSPLGVELPPGELPLEVELEGPDGFSFSGSLEVEPADFPARELTVSRKYIQPPRKVRRRMAADRKAFAKAYDQPFTRPYFQEPFGWPRPSEITAPFGDLRTFNGKRQSQHYGMDLDGRTGAPIWASNAGVVVMARDNYGSGRTVLIHHGMDLFTAYFHLSRIEVRQGQRVKKGRRIGRVGATGRVTGPHLHFAVKVSGLYVDPASLLRLQLTQ